MTSAVKNTSAVSQRYASALMDLAEEGKSLDRISKDFEEMGAMVSGSDDLQYVIRSVLIGKKAQRAAIGAIADKAKFHDLTKNFLALMSENSRLNILEEIIESFRRELSNRRGDVDVYVQTVQKLSVTQAGKLQSSISKSLGRNVTLKTEITPDILGGIVVTVGSYMIDDSVARKLELLKVSLSESGEQKAA